MENLETLRAETAAQRAAAISLLDAADGYSVQPQSRDKAYAGAELWLVVGAGVPVFAWAGRVFGDEYVIVAAASMPGAAGDWTVRGFAEIERIAFAACQSVAFQTIRPGLVQRAVDEAGYGVAGWILRKKKA